MSGFLSEGEAEEPFQITVFQFGVGFFWRVKTWIYLKQFGGERFQRGE